MVGEDVQLFGEDVRFGSNDVGLDWENVRLGWEVGKDVRFDVEDSSGRISCWLERMSGWLWSMSA